MKKKDPAKTPQTQNSKNNKQGGIKNRKKNDQYTGSLLG